MATDSSPSTSSQPPRLPSRYEIRRLTPEHFEWAMAVNNHSQLFHSTIFTKLYPEGLTKRFNAFAQLGKPLIVPMLEAGLCWGVFDLEYSYRHPSSAASGGAFLHDWSNDAATEEELLAAMDFPLVSVAVAADRFNKLDPVLMKPLIEQLPIWMYIGSSLAAQDPGNESRKPKQHGEVIERFGTATRIDYQGKGLMAGLARYLMWDAQQKGYRGILIDCLADEVAHVWSHPKQKGMKGEVVAKFWSVDYVAEDEDGNKFNPFEGTEQMISRCWVSLRE